MPKRRGTFENQQTKTRPVERLTQIAFVLAFSLAVARVTFSDFSRPSGEPLGTEAPRGAGPAAAMALDLLSFVPAILILSRRVSDREYVLRPVWSAIPLGLLAAWGLASVFWASDKFAALVSAFHLLAAVALIWAMAQLVRSWVRLRLVGALCAGLLLAYFAYSLTYKTIDLPSLKENWEKDRKQFLEERGLADDPFLAKQFENKVLRGELMGFFVSPNSMAAMVVLLLVISTGLAAQRMLDDRRDAGAYALLVLWPLAAWMIWQTGSRTAYITPILAMGLLALAWFWRDLLARNSVKLFWAAAGTVILGAAAVIAHGVYRNSLFHESLTFRWNYWVGAMRIFREHPFMGVGLENFGTYYLGVRLPHAAEEVKDPHNLVVRFMVELGIIGGVLCLAWMGRLAWELTRPVVPPAGSLAPPAPVPAADPQPASLQYNSIKTIGLIAALGMLINLLASIDFTADAVFVLNEILRRVVLFAMLALLAIVASVRSLKEPALDERPAPLLLYALLVGLGIFVLHNMIDFSISEPGPLSLFAVLAGSALGVRQPSLAGKRRQTAAAAVALGGAVIATLVMAGFLFAPTAVAENAAYDANEAMRSRRPSEAAKLLLRARESQPLNADYALRAAQAMMAAGHSTDQVLAILKSAINTNPRDASYYLARARYLFGSRERDGYQDQILEDLAKAVRLNPNDVQLRIEYGDALQHFRKPQAARQQYEEALKFNSMLKEDEPKRLTGDRLKDLEGKVKAP